MRRKRFLHQFKTKELHNKLHIDINGLYKKQNYNSEFPSGLYSITDLVVKGRPERGELWVGEFVALVVKSSTDFSSKLPLSELSMSCL